jgi:transposase-like protein
VTDTPCTLIEAVRYFSDLEVCNAYMARIRWSDGKAVCPACGAKGERIGQIATRGMLRCKDCRKQFSHKVGTIFEDSPLGLDKWFVAVWSIANCKNGISSHELARALGVTQKTAWFMLHRIRKAMEVGGFDKLDGPAEADATYIGGKAKNMQDGRCWRCSSRFIDQIRLSERLRPFRTPEEAEAAYDAAPSMPLPEGMIRDMVDRITKQDRRPKHGSKETQGVEGV